MTGLSRYKNPQDLHISDLTVKTVGCFCKKKIEKKTQEVVRRVLTSASVGLLFLPGADI